MIKEELKNNDKSSYSKYHDDGNYRLVIIPNDIGVTEDEFDFDGMVGLVRVIYKSPLPYSPCFKHIIIGESKLNWYAIISAYGGYLGIDDFPFNAEFKKGDKFKLLTDSPIQRIELFLARKINTHRRLRPNIFDEKIEFYAPPQIIPNNKKQTTMKTSDEVEKLAFDLYQIERGKDEMTLHQLCKVAGFIDGYAIALRDNHNPILNKDTVIHDKLALLFNHIQHSFPIDEVASNMVEDILKSISKK